MGVYDLLIMGNHIFNSFLQLIIGFCQLAGVLVVERLAGKLWDLVSGSSERPPSSEQKLGLCRCARSDD